MRGRTAVALMLLVQAAVFGAWYSYHHCQVPVGECAPKDRLVVQEVPVVLDHFINKTVYRNQTIYFNQTIQPPPDNKTKQELIDEAEGHPSYVVAFEPAKYPVPGLAYDVQAGVSGAFGVEVPWAGNGPPYLFFKFHAAGTQEPFNDTGMLMYGSLQIGGVGYSLCSLDFYRFWNWTVMPAPVNTWTYYWSMPTNNDPTNYFQGGENCYTRVLALSEWYAYVCIEGDGAISKPVTKVTDEDGDELPEAFDIKFDKRDECGGWPGSFP